MSADPSDAVVASRTGGEPVDTGVAWSLEEVAPRASVVTIGVFDGVHRGHGTIIGRAVRSAEDEGLRSVALTFDRHPREVVEPGSQPRYLQPLDRRVRSLLAAGVELVVVLPFTLELSQHPPADFVAETLAGPVRARRVVVGSNFRFGHKAAGDVVTLTELGDAQGFEVEAVTLLEMGGTTISSTRIREHLADGDVSWAARALGRRHVVEGPVVRGEGRGRKIGVPTANVEVDDRMLIPARGVYAGLATVDGGEQRHPAVVNIGVRPTFGGGRMTVEAHLLDVDDVELYGRHLAVHFERRLRDERAFDDVDALVEQIHTDIDRARDVLAEVRA